MSFNRRNFIKGLGLVGLGANLPVGVQAHPKEQNQAFDFATQPYLQNLQPNQVTVCCIFTKPCFAWLEVLDANNNILKTVYQIEDGMRNCNTEHFKFTADRTGTSLNYRVVAKEITKFEPYKIEYGQTIHSKAYQATLPLENQESINCLILNDVHENTMSYGLLYQKSKIAKKDLIFLNGDSFHYVSSQKDLTEKLLKPISADFASRSPFVMVRGNHETRGSFARSFKQYFDYPQNKFYHSFKMGPVYWIVLDSGEDKPDTHDVYAGTVDYDGYRLEQKAWLAQVLKSKERKSAKYTIVVTHIPFHHADDWHGTQHNKASFHELLQQHKVDAVISGHTHQFGFHPPDATHNYYVIIGAGPKEGERTFIEVSANKKELQVNLVKETGELINSFQKKA